MQTKKQCKQAIKQEIGWAYSHLNWLTDEEAILITEDRDQLLRALEGKLNYSYCQNKIHRGDLSPGCVTCGDGTWSCLYINGLCTANCFFCPQDRGMEEERPPATDDAIFHRAKDYADFVQKVGFKGVGFSGGESLLAYETLLSFIRELREKLGNNIYLWIYTNGDLVNKNTLKGLKQAGLNEIRFNIAARDYTLRSVELALDFIETVTVEIPAIPEDLEVLKTALHVMDIRGVHHLNLHQLLTTPSNYKAFASRNYTFLHYKGVPVIESEMAALKLMLYAIENEISLPINYCSQAYKYRFHGRSRRIRAASLLKQEFEDITDLGYIRRVTIEGTPTKLEHIIGVLVAKGCPDTQWSLTEHCSALAIHSSLLQHIDERDCKYTLSYFAPCLRDANYNSLLKYDNTNDDLVRRGYFGADAHDDTNSGITVQELVLNPECALLAVKEPVVEYRRLSLVMIKSFYKLILDNMNLREVLKWFSINYDISTDENIKDMAKEKNILRHLATWEQVQTGSPEIV